MFIQCDCSIDLGYPPDVSHTEIRKARKDHECIECGRIIRKGERYEYSTQCDGGEWSTHKTCLGCYRIREYFCHYGWIWGNVANQVEECIGFNYVTENY